MALYLSNSPQLIVSLFGNHLLGVITVPVNPACTAEEFKHVATLAEINALVSGQSYPSALKLHLRPAEFWSVLEESSGDFPEDKDLDAPALLCFTSGTTARPKGVLLTHRNIRSNIQDLVQVWQWTSQDRLLLALPLFHIHGLGVGLHGWAMTGCTGFVTERFDPDQVARLLTEQRCTLFMGVPTMYRRLLDVYHAGRARTPRLRLAISGSAPMPVELHQRCEKAFGQTILERYGMTETIMNTSNPLEGSRKPGSVGLPLPSVQIRLLDDNLQEIIQPYESGEVCIKGPNVFSGYWKDPEATRVSFVDGWFRSGDVGYKDEDGYYHLQGRLASDFVKSGGHRIGTREVEEALERHPAVKEAAVVGMPDEDLGERVTAFVVTKLRMDEDQLISHCKNHLATYKCPRSVIFVESLPKNAMGKIMKSLLKV